MNSLTKNFLLGVGSILSIFPSAQSHNSSDNFQTDHDSLAGDWVNIGNDMYHSMGVVRDEQEEAKRK